MKKPVRKDTRTPTYLGTPTIGPLYDGLYYGVGKRRSILRGLGITNRGSSETRRRWKVIWIFLEGTFCTFPRGSSSE